MLFDIATSFWQLELHVQDALAEMGAVEHSCLWDSGSARQVARKASIGS